MELSNAARQIASGNFDVPISSMDGPEEPGQLASDFALISQVWSNLIDNAGEQRFNTVKEDNKSERRNIINQKIN